MDWILDGSGLAGVRSLVVIRINMEEVSNSDSQFWLYQGPPFNLLMTCNVDYHFDRPLNVDMLKEHLRDMVEANVIFRRNIVEVNKIPFWQNVSPIWTVNFMLLEAGDDAEEWRRKSDHDVSQPNLEGEGIPLFRACVTPNRQIFVFTWHHAISDYEGMFNLHARYLFAKSDERTKYGYQLRVPSTSGPYQFWDSSLTSLYNKAYSLFWNLLDTERKYGAAGKRFTVTRFEIPVDAHKLAAQGARVGLPMSDIFSLIALRTVTRYHEVTNDPNKGLVRPVTSPLSLRHDSLDCPSETIGNKRALKYFPLVHPLESMDTMCHRIVHLPPTLCDYDMAGRSCKAMKAWPRVEYLMRRLNFPDYVSNYFPLADGPLCCDGASLVRHDLRVCMVPYERTKFAWSHFNGGVQLFLHMAPHLNSVQDMTTAFEESVAEVLSFLEMKST